MLKIYNTATRKKDEFKPLKENIVTVYTCGMTVYSYTHIGHLKAYLTSDILCRYLRLVGYDVKQVMNVTDVGHHQNDADDGIDALDHKAIEENTSPWLIARKYEKVFFNNLTDMNISKPNIIARASEHVNEMIQLIERLEEKGLVYKTSVGITYDTGKFPRYADFAKLNLENQNAGVSVAIDDERKVPWDFALWILNKPKHIMKWDSPWGVGYPGWHIECSAMCHKYLGEQIDIHTGGVDHIPIHHTNEIAQSEGASGKKFVNYWMHTAFLNVDGRKMSKSLGNLYTLEDLKEKGYSPLCLRYLLLKGDYRKPFNFTWESLHNATNELVILWKRIINLQIGCGEIIDAFRNQFIEAMNDNFNTAKAISCLWDVLNSNYSDRDKATTVFYFDEVFGLDLMNSSHQLCMLEDLQNIDPLQKQQARLLLVNRNRARVNKDYKRADQIREIIENMGYIVEDRKESSVVGINRFGKL